VNILATNILLHAILKIFSPGPGKTNYGGDCRYDHPCAKHQNKPYYWCYADNIGNWNYCTPGWDRNELIVLEHNFRGNFGFKSSQLPVGNSTAPANAPNSQGTRWPGYPKLYRILFTKETGNVDEGDGLNGLKSTGAHHSLFKKSVPYWEILDHVAFDPQFSPFISATPEKEKLFNQATDYVSTSRQPLYIVTIDAEQLR